MSHFATVLAAGELASQLNILQQSTNGIKAAVFKVAKSWHYGLGQLEHPVNSIVNSLKDWIAQNAKSGLCGINELGKPVEHRAKRGGWYDGQHYFLMRDTLADALGVKPEDKAAFAHAVRQLVDCQIIVPGGSADSHQFKMGSAFEGRPNVYRISKAALERA